MTAIPEVKNAKVISIPYSDGLALPSKFNVAYTCQEGYELMSDSNKVRCEYDMMPREGAPADDDTKLVTSVWRGQDDIQCEKGM